MHHRYCKETAVRIAPPLFWGTTFCNLYVLHSDMRKNRQMFFAYRTMNDKIINLPVRLHFLHLFRLRHILRFKYFIERFLR